jgi:hypothetical protein
MMTFSNATGICVFGLIIQIAWGASTATAAAPAKKAAAADQALVRIDKVTNPADIIMMYPANKPIQVTFTLKNQAGKPLALDAVFTFIDRNWKVYDSQLRSVEASADTPTDLTFTVQSQRLSYGQYSARLMLKSSNKEVVRSSAYVGVVSATELRKARPGEFLFGLDASLVPAYGDPRLLRFTQYMGTDILRGGIAAWRDRVNTWDDQIEKAAPVYRQYDLKLAYDVDPPDNRIKDREGYLAAATRHLERVAREYKGLIPFFELGNEPDIGFFVGPMSLYADGYVKLRQAIKRGNPDAVVMNGGWAYAADRIDEFYRIVKPVDVDLIAYHGHGDVTSEERAYQKVKAIAASHGFGDKLLTETESGIMALTAPQEEVQARVCVEKFVFAQSMREPFFHWFRLVFENPGEYGCTWWRTQPRPVVLSYRATVETLRGYRYKRTFQLPYSDCEGYEFDQIDGPGRACVFWADGRQRRQAYLRIAPTPANAGDLATSDIYGNRRPLRLLEGGIAALPISEEPTWLLWSALSPFDANVEPSLIQTPATAELQAGFANPLVVQVRNPLSAAVSAGLDVKSQSEVQLAVAPATSSFRLQPHEVKRVELAARVGEFHPTIQWPVQWTVFCRPARSVALADIAGIPPTLPGDNGPVAPTREILRGGKIDLSRLANYQWGQEKTSAIVMACVESDADRTVTMGAGADFWMEWFVNGRPAFDDLAVGNGPGCTMFDHPFPINLKKGRNLLVCRVLAGSQGFALAMGGPAQLEKASAGIPKNAIQLTYTYNGTNTVEQSLDLSFQHAVEPLGELALDSPLAAWESSAPDVILDEHNLVNLHFKDPDSTLWWKGYNDLSAVAWLRADKFHLYLLLKVTDDKHRPAPVAAKLGEFDSIQLACSPTGNDDISSYRIGLVGTETAIVKVRRDGGSPAGELAAGNGEIRASVHRDDATGTTVYRIALRRPANTFYLNFLVNDNDTGARKQYLYWKPGMETLADPSGWYRVR